MKALISGAMLALCLSGYSYVTLLAWVALIPLFFALRDSTWRGAFPAGAAFGLGFGVGYLFWLPATIRNLCGSYSMGLLFLAVLCGFWMVYFGAWAFIQVVVTERATRNRQGLLAILVPAFMTAALWVVWEYGLNLVLRGVGFSFISSIGYSQWGQIPLLQMAAVSGVFGLSFLIVLVNLAIFTALTRRKTGFLLVMAGVVLLCYGCGYLRLRLAEPPTAEKAVRIAILQGNIPATYKFDKTKVDFMAKRYLELDREAVKSKPQLVIWTETAVPWAMDEGDDLVETMLGITRESGACHLVGSLFRKSAVETNLFYNTAFLVLPDGTVTGYYNKNKMIPVAETPLYLPWRTEPLSVSAAPGTVRFVSSQSHDLLTSPVGRFGVFICNESLYSGLLREYALNGAEFLVNTGNDAWFESEVVLLQHYYLNRFRAVECGREIAIANNVGYSGVVDAYGRERSRSPGWQSLAAKGTVYRQGIRTLYAEYGDLFVLACGLFYLASLVVQMAMTSPALTFSRRQEGTRRP